MQHPYMCLVPRLPETHSLASPLVENVGIFRSFLGMPDEGRVARHVEDEGVSCRHEVQGE